MSKPLVIFHQTGALLRFSVNKKVPSLLQSTISVRNISISIKKRPSPKISGLKMSATRHNIIKSPDDDREYRGLVLPNGLKAILVSDPSTDRSAAALDVHVGNMSDPDELQGLVSHF
jgi:hypothetical protein